MSGPILLLRLVELLFALAAVVTGTYRTVCMVRDRRDARRDAQYEAEYEARKQARKDAEKQARAVAGGDTARAVPPSVRLDKPDGTTG